MFFNARLQVLSGALNGLVNGVHGAAFFLREPLWAAIVVVVALDQAMLLIGQFLQAVGKVLTDRVGPFRVPFHFLLEDLCGFAGQGGAFLLAGQKSSGVNAGEPHGPVDEGALRIVGIELPPECHGGLLHDFPGIVLMRNDDEDGAHHHGLTLKEKPGELLVCVVNVF